MPDRFGLESTIESVVGHQRDPSPA
jgi:hypothetical protein